ncbi:MAG: hypothetical protein ACR2RV_25330 [Verrucomicrobiales bacterium]
MNSEPDDIRRIARAARPSGKDDHEPEIKAALEALVDHPELAAELAAERSDDLQISESVRGIEPPADLEERLLATLRSARASQSAASGEPDARRFTRRHWLGAAAAAIATSAAGAFWWSQNRRLPIDRLVSDLAQISRDGVTLSVMSMETEEVVGWLVANDAPRATSLPPDLDALGRKGCHIYDIDGLRVSLECFLLPGMLELHLFTTPSEKLSGSPTPSEGKIVRQEGDLTAAIWSQGENTMILVTGAAQDTVGELVRTA